MAKSKKNSVNRRGFLKGAAVGAAAIVAGQNANAQTAAAQPGQARAATALPSAALARVETAAPPPADVYTTDRPGSDFMVDVIKSLGVEYIAANPGSTFRALHESIINYGGNEKPELITCMHEESAVAMAHGYFKIEGRPLAVVAQQWAAPRWLVAPELPVATLRRPGGRPDLEVLYWCQVDPDRVYECLAAGAPLPDRHGR